MGHVTLACHVGILVLYTSYIITDCMTYDITVITVNKGYPAFLTSYRMVGYFCGLKFHHLGSYLWFCGFIFLWHTYNHKAKIQQFSWIRKPTKSMKIWIPWNLPTIQYRLYTCVCIMLLATQLHKHLSIWGVSS